MIEKNNNRKIGLVASMAGLAIILIIVIMQRTDLGILYHMPGKAFGAYACEMLRDKVHNIYTPILSYGGKINIVQQLSMIPAGEIMPLYSFGWSHNIEGVDTEDSTDSNYIEQTNIEMITMDETQDKVQDDVSDETQGEMDFMEEMQKENSLLYPAAFVPHTEKLGQVDLNSLKDYETLVQTFYTIDKSTMIGSDQLNAEKLSTADMRISKEETGPQILIYHTHSQEAFADSVPGDPSTTIVGIGAYLTEILTNEYGYQVLHHSGEYDVPSRDDAYSVALPQIQQLLTDHPQIQVIIDLHRDAMDENTRLVTEIDGLATARFMFFNGLSRTRKTGNISYLYNENLDSNLAFSFQLQKAAMEYYPGLTRKIYLKAYRYNMHLRPRNLLIELGAQNNTVEEAKNACLPLAHLLDLVLSGTE